MAAASYRGRRRRRLNHEHEQPALWRSRQHDQQLAGQILPQGLLGSVRSPDKGLVPADVADSRHRHNGRLSLLRPVVGTTSHGAPQALRPQAHSSHLQLLPSPPQLLAVLRRPRRCLAQTLQLEVRARRLLQLAPCAKGGERRLYLFPSQTHGTPRHGVLRSSQEGQANHVPAHVSPHRDANDLVGSCQILSGRSRYIHRCHQQLRPHHHVLVLHARGCRASVAEVPLVEKVHHDAADGPILPGFHAQLPASDLRLRVSQVVARLHSSQRHILLLPLLRVLQQGLHAGATGGLRRREEEEKRRRGSGRGYPDQRQSQWCAAKRQDRSERQRLGGQRQIQRQWQNQIGLDRSICNRPTVNRRFV
ncbi:uncharacterized protein LOC100115103 isoform X1 [Nasonia vitripennis]|uniref:Uncharacterized protein n=1 Tax=Nasonia vitripennis TaxID=7425 RepID=A0A7M7IVV5_NASVI|nr:uncharacterized protein LOC100115103 isoform X1 [Nasonia vitripennis]